MLSVRELDPYPTISIFLGILSFLHGFALTLVVLFIMKRRFPVNLHITIYILEKRRSHGNELQVGNMVLEGSFCCVMEICSEGESSRGPMS